MLTLPIKPKTSNQGYLGNNFHPFERYNKNDFLDFGNENSETVPSVNITEKKDGYKIEMPAPGLSMEDFNIDVTDNVITISCEKESETKDDGEKKYSFREYNYSCFSRSFTIPDNGDVSHIEAKYNDGVLSLNVPKKEKDKETSTHKIKVD